MVNNIRNIITRSLIYKRHHELETNDILYNFEIYVVSSLICLLFASQILSNLSLNATRFIHVKYLCFTYTPQIAYRIAICPRGNLPYIRNYPINNTVFNLIYSVGSWIYDNIYPISDFTLLPVTL